MPADHDLTLLPMTSIAARLAEELKIQVRQVEAAIALLDEKATVPFIARYRKEATGGLDDTQLRLLDERLTLPARARGAPRGDPQEHRGAGQADAGARGRDRRRRHQGAARGPVPAVQAEAADQGADRARGRARAARATRCCRIRRACPRRGRARFVDAEKGVADVGRGARGRALDPDRDVRRGRRAGRRPAPAAVGPRRVDVHASCREGGRGRQVLGLLRCDRAGARDAVAPRAGAAARPPRRLPAPERRPAGGCGRRRARRSRSGASPARAGIEHRGRAGRRVARRDGPLAWRSRCFVTSSSTSSSGCASTPRRKPSACSAATCATCCSRRPPGSASRWDSIPASAPASRSPSSTAPARCSRPRPSIRTSRATIGKARCGRSPALRRRIACS